MSISAMPYFEKFSPEELRYIFNYGTTENSKPITTNFTEDYAKLVNNQEFSDVKFKVGQSIIYGHKNILSGIIYFEKINLC